MFSLIYDFFLSLFALIALPKLLWQWFILGKYRGSLKERLGIIRPSFVSQPGQKVIWIHAVSMGETRAVIPLYQRLRRTHPEAAIVISNTTETGHAEAKRSMPDAHAHFFLPLDFSWIIRRMIKQIKPSVLVLCESDFWYHLLKISKEKDAKIILVNGKISERSTRRFRKIPFFTRRLFKNFDLMLLQSQRYYDRFHSLKIPSEKLYITGNLKLDIPIKKLGIVEAETLKQSLNIKAGDKVLVIGSTHAPEEDWLLSALQPAWSRLPNLKVLLVPRHPERFNEVAHLLQEKCLPFQRLSIKKKEEQRIILIDAMGFLNACYQIADIAVVGGSFTSTVGGHNIFEPVIHGVPVLFGPHMHNQPDFKEMIISAKAGKEVSLENLLENLIKLLEHPETYRKYVAACHQLVASVQGATERTAQKLELFLK